MDEPLLRSAEFLPRAEAAGFRAAANSFGERDLQHRSILSNLNCRKADLIQELLKLVFRIRSLEQHETERQLGERPVHCPQVHLIDGLGDRFV
jgi:hypothetical protein